jgi:hypothetical protein
LAAWKNSDWKNFDCKRRKDDHTHNSRQGLNVYRTDDAIDNFQHSKHLEQKLKNPVKTANPSNAWNDEYDHGSINDDDLPNSARRSRGHGITDGNFDFDDFPVRGEKWLHTVHSSLYHLVLSPSIYCK